MRRFLERVQLRPNCRLLLTPCVANFCVRVTRLRLKWYLCAGRGFLKRRLLTIAWGALLETVVSLPTNLRAHALGV
jgi:hypothetical protein